MKLLKRVSGLLLSAAFLLLTPLSIAQAQSTDDLGPLNLTTSPLPISLSAKPGETIKTELRVKNGNTKTEQLKVGLMKFSAYGEEGKPQLLDREAGDDYFDWVTFSETQFSAEPGQWRTIDMTIALQETAALGYYYAVTFSRAADNTPENIGQAASISGASATLILMEVDSPNAKRSLELESFQISRRSYEFLPAKFSVKLKNTGNIHAVPAGNIFINKGGKNVATISLNEARGNILADSSRVFDVEWGDGFPVYELKEQNGSVVYKNDQPQYELSWEFDKLKNLRFGRYTAQLTATYDDGEKDVPLEAEVSFWVIPWRLLALGIGIPFVILITIVYLIYSRRKYKRKAVYRQ